VAKVQKQLNDTILSNDNQMLQLQHDKEKLDSITNERIEALNTLVAELRN